MSSSLGPHGLSVVVDLLDSIGLGSGGIHLVVTERARTVRAEIEARRPPGWVIEALLASDRDRLCAAAYEDTAAQNIIFLDVVHPMDEREHAALRALNTDREWLMRSGRCAVILVAGEDAAAADAAYLELQRLAPDFWSVRNRVHRTVGPDPQQRAVDNLVDLLKPRFGGDRGAAARWLDTRRFQEDWLTYRLWRDGPSREAWLAMAAPTSIGRLETRLELERGILLDSHRSIEPSWSTEPIGEAIDHQRWPTPVWPSGRLDPEQHALVSALGAMLDRQGNATLYRLPEEQTSKRLDDAVNTLGLLRESRYAKVLHLDSSEGLEFAIVRCLHEAGESDLMPGLVQAARRLAGALGETRILLLVTSVTYTDLLFLRAALPRTEFVASVLGAPRSMFCVLGSRYHGAHLRWATGQLSRWPAGTKQLTIDSETAVLDLRTALAGAKHVVLLADSRLSDLSTEEWNPVALASSRVVGFSIGAPPFPTTSVVTWRGDLGRNEATALDRLLAVAHELAGDPLGTEGPARAPWPTTDIVADDPSALQQESFSGRNVNTADTSHSATSIAVEDQPLVRAFKPWAARAPRTGQPARLLEAAYEAVPFDGRTDVLEILRRFTDGPERNGVQVIVGPSGAGKTRLLLEWCKRLRNRDQPWLAGFLKNELPEDLAVLTLGRAPRLVVLDYADCEPANAATVVRTMLRRREGPPMRVVLLARDDGSWLRDLRRQDDVEVEACLGAHEVVRLGPLYKTAEDRARGLSIAKARFLDIEGAKAASGTSAASQQTVFEEGQGERVLYLHMQALLQALGDGDTPQIQPTASEVLERVLDHECGFWWKSIQARGQSVSDRLREGALLAAAALVLCGGVPDVTAADRLFQAAAPDLPDDERRAVIQGFAELYKGEDEEIVPLEPDLLGETLLARVLQLEARREGGLDRWLALPFGDAAPPLAVGRALAVLTRLASRSVGVEWLQALLRKRGPELVNSVHRSANEGQPEPKASVLEEAVRCVEDFEVAEAIGDAVPKETIELREVRATAYGVAIRLARGRDEFDEGRRARVLNKLGRAQSAVGRPAEARGTMEEALEAFRELVKKRPDVFLPDLAASLHNLGVLLSELGKRDEALGVTEKAVKIRRGLAKERPDAFLPDLATSLSNLGVDLSAAGRQEAALGVTQEALDIRRGLAKKRPDAFLPDLAGSLHNLGVLLSELGKRDEALGVTQEALDIRRRLAKERPDAFLPDLARSLSTFGVGLSAAGRREDALDVTQEAVDIHRRLAEEQPDVFLPDLATSLNNLGVGLSAAGRRDEALRVTQDAVDIHRRLAKERPDVFLSELATSLSNLGVDLSAAGRRDDALDVTQEALGIRRQLATERPDTFLLDLATSLHNLGADLSAAGMRDEALAVTQEAVDIRRGLVKERPDAFLPDLATSLSNFGVRLSESGRPDEALGVTQEAVDIRRGLAKERPVFLPDLARSLNNLGVDLSAVGRREEALVVTHEAVDIRRGLAKERPAFLPDLASSISNLGIRLSELGRPDEALSITQEAVDIRRGLTKERPYTFLPVLATSLSNLGIDLGAAGRQDEALGVTQEAVDIHRGLAKERPAFFPDLARSLSNLGIRLRESGKPDEALVVTREAVDVRRRLAKERPAFLHDLARSLNNFGVRLSESGKPDEALGVTLEAVEVFRELVQERPAMFRPDLATSLNNLGIRLSELGRPDDALVVTEEAVEIRKVIRTTASRTGSPKHDIVGPGLRSTNPAKLATNPRRPA